MSTIPSNCYAELFESTNGSALEPGRSVVFDGEKVRYARQEADADNPADPNYLIVGVVQPKTNIDDWGVVGRAGEECWCGKYLRNDYGQYLLDDNGDKLINPTFDPEQVYIPRSQRAEWNRIALKGLAVVQIREPRNETWMLVRTISASTELYLLP